MVCPDEVEQEFFENPQICLRPFTKEIEGDVLIDMLFGDSGSLDRCRSTDTPQQHPRINTCTLLSTYFQSNQ